MVEEELEDQILKWAKNYAREHGYALNPDDKRLQVVIRGLARNMRKYGEKYCPCRIRSGDNEADKKIICPCEFHRDEIEGEGSCHCSLYFKPENK
jgi:ferredoxin-thioredoxin reductase catalytic chain